MKSYFTMTKEVKTLIWKLRLLDTTAKKMKGISSTYTHASFTETSKLQPHKYGANK